MDLEHTFKKCRCPRCRNIAERMVDMETGLLYADCGTCDDVILLDVPQESSGPIGAATLEALRFEATDKVALARDYRPKATIETKRRASQVRRRLQRIHRATGMSWTELGTRLGYKNMWSTLHALRKGSICGKALDRIERALETITV